MLQRDLDREREKLKAATVPIAMDTTEDGRQAPLSSEPSTATSTESTAQKPGPLRRQSTISLSSLHRAPFPHKLDLSSIPLRLNTDEAPIQSGLASPVSLAPKSSISRASMPPDLLSAAGQTVDIDLTVPDDADLTAGMQGAIPMGPQPQGVPANLIGLDPTLGSTADKPIELDDFDMDMFSEDAARPVNQGSSSTSFKLPESVPPKLKQEDAVIDLDLFGSLNKAGGESMDGKHEGDILSALGTSIQGAAQATSQASNSTQPSGSQVPSSSSAVPGTDQHNYDFDLNMFDSGMEDFLKPDNLNASAGSSGA